MCKRCDEKFPGCDGNCTSEHCVWNCDKFPYCKSCDSDRCLECKDDYQQPRLRQQELRAAQTGGAPFHETGSDGAAGGPPGGRLFPTEALRRQKIGARFGAMVRSGAKPIDPAPKSWNITAPKSRIRRQTIRRQIRRQIFRRPNRRQAKIQGPQTAAERRIREQFANYFDNCFHRSMKTWLSLPEGPQRSNID